MTDISLGKTKSGDETELICEWVVCLPFASLAHDLVHGVLRVGEMTSLCKRPPSLLTHDFLVPMGAYSGQYYGNYKVFQLSHNITLHLLNKIHCVHTLRILTALQIDSTYCSTPAHPAAVHC